MHELLLEVKGQTSALNILHNIYSSKRIPNAILLTGIEGIGKYYSAIQLLKLLNGNSNLINQKISNLSEPYVKLIFPLPRGKSESNFDSPLDKLSQDEIEIINEQVKQKSVNSYHQIHIKNANNIKISSIREINKTLSLNYDEITYRGIIIIDAHKMSIEAQNAFLKNLEEPPNGVIFILISNQPDQLLTTIKSRCWTINFSPLNENEIKQILITKFDYSEEVIDYVLPFTNGSVTNAVFLLENDFEKYIQKSITILRYSLAGKYFTASKEFSSLIENNSGTDFSTIIDLIITWFNDTLRSKFEINNIKFNNYKDTLEKFNSRFLKTDTNEIIAKLVSYREAAERNVNLNLIMMNVIFEIASIGMKAK
ncbi:MAG: DNA polymerase III subunit delta' C-terminal domain-containing protein [Melioribacteraceae bacterium]